MTYDKFFNIIFFNVLNTLGPKHKQEMLKKYEDEAYKSPNAAINKAYDLIVYEISDSYSFRFEGRTYEGQTYRGPLVTSQVNILCR